MMISPYNDVLGHLSYSLTALSFFMRDILLLRILAIASLLVGMVFSYRVPGGPIWLVISWQLALLTINVVRIIFHILERRDISFSEEEQELYRTIFRRFEPVEFLKLIRLGKWLEADPGTVLVKQNEPLNQLMLIFNGEVSIVRNDVEHDRSRDGTLIGEVSFVQGGNATANVRVMRPTRYVSWERDELRKLLRRNPTMDLAMQTVLSADLTRKLTERSVPEG